MTSLKDVMRNQPYPCFRVARVPEGLGARLKVGAACLYRIEERIFEFPLVGQIGPAEELFDYLGFVGYYTVEQFRDLVFASRLPVSCPSCKGPVEDAGLISFEVEEGGTAELDFVNGDAEAFVCTHCGRPFAVMSAQ